jgi:carboxyl-terminal processing protease
MKRKPYILIITALILAACSGAPSITPAPPLPTISPADRQTRVLDAFFDAISGQYIYGEADSANLDTLRADTLTKVNDGLTHTEFEETLAGLVEQLPADSVVYQTRDERISLELDNTALYSGIGAYISVRNEPEPHVVIMAVIKGSPAEAAGLQAHDSIYSIDGVAVTAEEGLTVVQRVRGEPGSTVTLEVVSPDGETRTLEVTRARLTAVDTLQAFVLGDTDVAYLRFPVSADSTLMDQMAGVMQSIASRGDVNGIILDLRVSRSSTAWPLSEMFALFADGELGAFYSREETTPVEVTGLNIGDSQNLPMVILVGPDTEGTPEIFAAALQDSGRATVIGLPTSGKIFGYQTVPLPDGSRLTLATSSYKTQSGQDLGEVGVEPDVLVEEDWDQVNDQDDPLIIKSLSVILGEP